MSDALKLRYEFASGAWVEFKTKLAGRRVMPIMARFQKGEGEGVRVEEVVAMADDLLPVIVAAWSWPGDPAQLASYDDIDLADYNDLLTAMGEYVAAKTAGKVEPTSEAVTS